MQRDSQRSQLIAMTRIAHAEEYYSELGYVPRAVPWVVREEAYMVTFPDEPDIRRYTTLEGFLVASGEQSFIQLMLNGVELGQAQCTTPCFRDEPHDALHDPYFMKTELIRTDDTSTEALQVMITDAEKFFRMYVEAERVLMDDGTYDIVHPPTGIELGSYGKREYRGYTWLYGTGLAEPRLQRVINSSGR